jgi:glutamate-1-semialdehyde 2,1-aminomutase
MVAVCAEHAFFSVDDWFIGSTPMATGIPEAVRNLTVKFNFNDIASVQRLFDNYPGKIACIIMEAATTVEPAEDFLQNLKELAHVNGALLILDEIITGFRWHIGGAQKFYGVVPDLSAFGKAMANGFSVSALLGKREIMELGGLFHENERVFLLSTTHGAENHALAAALETISTYKREDVIGYLMQAGARLAKGINRIIEELELGDFFHLNGKPCNLVYATKDQDKEPSQPFRTLFLQETIRRGLLMPSLVVSFSHTDRDIDLTVEAIGGALWIYRKALDEGIEKYLVGRPVKPVFRRFN